MKSFDFEEILALVDEKERKTKDGITMAITDLEEYDFPKICHFRDMNELLAEMILRLELSRERIIVVAVEFLGLLPYERHKLLYGDEKILDTALKKLEPSDLKIFEEQDPSCGKCLRWFTLLEKYTFLNGEDVKRFVPALQKKAYENLQEELIDRAETRK